MCSLTITPSNPAASASTAIRTSPRTSRGGTSVQFSLRIRISFGARAATEPEDTEPSGGRGGADPDGLAGLQPEPLGRVLGMAAEHRVPAARVEDRPSLARLDLRVRGDAAGADRARHALDQERRRVVEPRR